MIFIGYPGVGKSSVSNGDMSVIDLESANFSASYRQKDNDWTEPYINVAIDLHNQGYKVFVSSHYAVRNELYQRTLKDEIDRREVVTISPDSALKELWLQRLKDRYEANGEEKHKRAYERAKDHFEDDINDMLNDNNFENIIIKDIKYDLKDLINEYIIKLNGKVYLGGDINITDIRIRPSFDEVYIEISKETTKSLFHEVGSVPYNDGGSDTPDESYVLGELQFVFDKDTNNIREILLFPVYFDTEEDQYQNGDFVNITNNLEYSEEIHLEILKRLNDDRARIQKIKYNIL